jgi:hypothetical protein
MPRREGLVPLLGLAWLWCVGCQDAVSASSQPAPANAAQPSAAEPACGRTGLPDCPLQNWMKATLQTYQRAADYERLARSLGELAEHGPADYAGWQALTGRGVEAAHAKDDASLRQVCKDCHAQHRARYRRELRSRAVW